MRIVSSLLLIVTLAVTAAGADAAMPGPSAAQWQHLVVRGTGIAVDLPGAPVKGNDLTIDGLRSVVYRLESGDTRTYDVRCEQMPAGQVALEGAQGVFNEIRNGLVEDGTLRAEWSLKGAPGVVGRGLIIDSAVKSGPDSYTMVAHIYLRGDWLYELLATVPRGGEHDPVAQRFLASARFVGE